jgi:phosphate/sulfate permease
MVMRACPSTQVLNTLGFELGVPTVLDFVNIFVIVVPALRASTRAQHFARWEGLPVSSHHVEENRAG